MITPNSPEGFMRRHPVPRLLAALAFFATFSAPAPAFPAAGDLDPAFSADGLVQVGFGQGHDGYNALALQADGKTVSVGFGTWASDRDWVIARNEVDGSRDYGFGDFGWVRASLSTGLDVANAVVLQPDQKIVVAGESNGQFAVMRLNTDGTPDATFGTAGVFRHGPADGSQAWSVRGVALQGSKVILFGKYVPGTTPVIVTMRLNANGTLDGTFGAGGLVTNPILQYAEATCGTVMSDSRIMVGGWASDAMGRRAAVALRYQVNGTPDPTWSGGGSLYHFFGIGNLEAYDIAILQGGAQPTRVAMVGYADGVSTRESAVMLYSEGGIPVSGFGTGGVRRYTWNTTGDDVLLGIRILHDVVGNPSMAFLCGRSRANNTGAFHDVLVAQIETATGAAEPSFDGDGFAIVSWSGRDDEATDLVLTEPAKLILAGALAQAGDKADAFLNRRSRLNGANDASYYVNGLWGADYGDAPSRGVDAAVRPDGRIWVAGGHDGDTWDIALARLMPDGSPDDSFTFDGEQVHNGNGDDFVNAMALLPDGRVLVCGSSQFPAADQNFMLARFLDDGSWDASFDLDGWLVSGMDLSGQANDVLVQPDGRIVAVGYADAFGTTRARVTRFLADGAVDPTFNGTGHNVSNYDANYASWTAVARQSDGRILTAGFRRLDGFTNFMVARFNIDGTLDTSFGGVGYVHPQIANQGSVANAVTIRPDGRILVTGQAWTGAGAAHTIVRLLPDGSLDTSFGGDGSRLLYLAGGDGIDTGLLLDPAGRMYLSGAQEAGGTGVTDWSLLRLSHDGTYDNLWSGDGVALVPHLQPLGARAEEVVFDLGGKPVVVGQDGELMAIRRFDPGVATSAVPVEGATPSLQVSRPWPNPAFAGVTLAIASSARGPIHADVFDVSGRKVRTLAVPVLERHELTWDLADDGGAPVPDGVYFVRIESAGNRVTRRVAVTR
jgi:uncharacterized delta-60 repeat protein